MNTNMIISSCLLLMPGLYGISIHLYFQGIFSIIASCASIAYWMNPSFSWRRKLELCISTIYVIYFIGNGLYYSSNIFEWKLLLLVPFSSLTIMNYILSHILWKYNFESWNYFHISFNYWSCISQILAILIIHEKMCIIK